MNQYGILKMAREAGLLRGGDGWTEPHRWGVTEIERFASLIEQHLSYDGIHTCHAECQRPACVAMREAVKAEREACAQLCDEYVVPVSIEGAHPDYLIGKQMALQQAAQAIRERGEK
jgi:sirohydrochlorin ferrochelatase